MVDNSLPVGFRENMICTKVEEKKIIRKKDPLRFARRIESSRVRPAGNVTSGHRGPYRS